MLKFNIKSKYRRYGNWIINLSVLLCNSNIITSQSCLSNNDTQDYLPTNWPCQWNNGVIPFVFDYFALSPRRMRGFVRKAHQYLQERSCLVFKEQNPAEAAERDNFTYLFYTYSEVLESCCLPFFTKPIGRRLILITPICSLPSEVSHTTLHAMGLEHSRNEPFPDLRARAVLLPYNCQNYEEKEMLIYETQRSKLMIRDVRLKGRR